MLIRRIFEVASFCSNCGTELKSGQLFCKGCGTKVLSNDSLTSGNFPQMERATIKQNAVQKNNKNTYMAIFSIVGLILIGVAAYFVVNLLKEPKQEVSTTPVTSTVKEKDSESSVSIPQENESVAVNGEDSTLKDYTRKLNQLKITSGGTSIAIGNWEIINRNGILSLKARNLSSKDLNKIFELYDEGNYRPLQSWGREVYFLSEDLAQELNADWKIDVGNTCSREHPFSLSNADLAAYSGSCGYSIPVLSGTDKDNLAIVINSPVFFSTVNNDLPVTSEYILPDSDIRRLSRSEIEYLTLEELSLARNEIFARHGRIFKTDSLQIYFDRKPWYNPDPYYDDTLGSIERYNVNLIKSREEFLK
jgi:hypothetical protein